jgi:hypothetical protein
MNIRKMAGGSRLTNEITNTTSSLAAGRNTKISEILSEICASVRFSIINARMSHAAKTGWDRTHGEMLYSQFQATNLADWHDLDQKEGPLARRNAVSAGCGHAKRRAPNEKQCRINCDFIDARSVRAFWFRASAQASSVGGGFSAKFLS